MGDDGGAPTEGETEAAGARTQEVENETGAAEAPAEAPEVGSGGEAAAAGGAEAVSVAYRNTDRDLRAAARLAAHVLPNLVRVRRAARFSAALLAAALVVYLAVMFQNDGGRDPSALVLGGAGGGIAVLLAYSSRRFWAYHAARNPMSRDSLGDATFRADRAGITVTMPGSSGSHAWSRIERVAEGDDVVVFTVGPVLFMYVPARGLSDADRECLRQLAAGGPEWLDFRTGR